MSVHRNRIVALFLAALVGTLAVPAALAVNSGGGTVSNSAPTVPTFSSAAGPDQSKDTSDIFSGTVRDKNGEARIAEVSVEFTTAPGGVSTTLFDHAVTPADRAATAEPGSFGGDGFKVWNPAGTADGVLAFKFQYTWTVNGAYVVRALVDDQSNSDQFGPAADLSITISDGFTLSADPVDAAGAAQVGSSWGSWAAIPGATAVDSQNYLEIENSGNNPGQVVTLDFTPAVWTGTDGATFALNNNVKFACAETSTPAVAAPSSLSFTLGSSSASGSVTATFTGLGNYMYCTYQVEAIADPLLDQDYNASFTAS